LCRPAVHRRIVVNLLEDEVFCAFPGCSVDARGQAIIASGDAFLGSGAI